MHNILHPTPHLLQDLPHIRPDDLSLFVVVSGGDDLAVLVAGPLGRDEGEGCVFRDDRDAGEEVTVGRHGAGGVDVFDVC